MELAIDSATATASIALSAKGRVVAELTWRAGQSHTAQLLPRLQYLLEMGQTGLPQLTAVIVAVGPGSFNGLRAGIITAKGLAFSLGLPLVGVGTLAAEAYPFALTGRAVCPVIAVGRELVAGLFQGVGGGLRRLREEAVTTATELQSLPPDVILCGELSEELASRLGAIPSQRRAGHLAALGWQRLARGERDDPDTLQPCYLLRPPVPPPPSMKEVL